MSEEAFSQVRMGHTLSRNRWLYRALVASLAIHLVVIAFLPRFVDLAGTQSVELLSFVRIQPVHIQTPRPVLVRPAVAPVHAALAQPVKPRVKPATAPHAVGHRTIRSTARPQQQAPVVAAHARPGGSVASQGSVTAPAASTIPLEQQSAAPNRQSVGGYMPLFVDEPAPVLDPSVRKALLALGVHVTLTVTVDSAGHTQEVDFAPPLDANIERQIRSMLASASVGSGGVRRRRNLLGTSHDQTVVSRSGTRTIVPCARRPRAAISAPPSTATLANPKSPNPIGCRIVKRFAKSSVSVSIARSSVRAARSSRTYAERSDENCAATSATSVPETEP